MQVSRVWMPAVLTVAIGWSATGCSPSSDRHDTDKKTESKASEAYKESVPVQRAEYQRLQKKIGRNNVHSEDFKQVTSVNWEGKNILNRSHAPALNDAQFEGDLEIVHHVVGALDARGCARVALQHGGRGDVRDLLHTAGHLDEHFLQLVEIVLQLPTPGGGPPLHQPNRPVT